MTQTHTPGPWSARKAITTDDIGIMGGDGCLAECFSQIRCEGERAHKEQEANARLIAAAPDMLEALRLHQAWHDSENAGPDYGRQSRDTHPDGEKIWRAWWDNQLDLCDRATKATRAAIAKATGESA